MTATTVETGLSRRDVAVLRAVAAGRAELIGGRCPVVLVDGVCCCDQFGAARLVTAGLIAPAADRAVRCAAVLTAAGRAGLAVAA